MNNLLGSIDDPQTAGLLGLGLRLMSTPGRLGSAFGQAGLGALGDMRQAQASQDQRKRASLQEQMTLMQLAQAKRAEEEAAQQRELDNQFRAMIPAPLGQMMPGAPAMNAAQAESAVGTPGYGASSAQPQMGAPDPYQSLLFQAMQKRQIKPLDFIAATRKDTTPITLAPGAKLLRPGTYETLAENAKEDTTPSDWKLYQLSGAPQRGVTFDQWDLARRKATASNTSVSYGTPVQGIDDKGNAVFLQPTKDGSPPNIIPGVRPPKSGAEEKADAEKSARERQGKQMLSVMEDARAILQGGKATASGIGTVVDAGARVIGKTTAGAQDAARLSALSGWLVANVPRMEGPQSNYDVQNYMTMAGKVGDSTVPIPERLAALAEVEKLQRKYAEVNGTPLPAAKKPAASLDDLLNKYGN